MIRGVPDGLVRICRSSGASPIAWRLGWAAGPIGMAAGAPVATGPIESSAERPIAGCPARFIMSRARRA
eukprot:2442976-Pyramimonas_sp.AAC.1